MDNMTRRLRMHSVPCLAVSLSPVSALTHTEWDDNLQIMIGFSITDARTVLGLK
jgi:hypothetical protein